MLKEVEHLVFDKNQIPHYNRNNSWNYLHIVGVPAFRNFS